MKGQRGSILAGTIGLAIGITAAVAGFAVIAGNSGNVVADAESDLQLHYAAETGMHMGLRWLRTYKKNSTDLATWPADTVNLNSAYNEFTDMDGMRIKVRFSRTASGEYERAKMHAWATAGAGRDTLLITLFMAFSDLTNVESDAYCDSLYNMVLPRWTETFIPAN